MSELLTIQESAEITRRKVLATAAAAIFTGGMTHVDAQHVHEAVKEEKKAAAGPYKPKGLTEHEFATVQRLAEQIMPADDRGPSGKDVGAPEFIDLMCANSKDMLRIYTAGILWLDTTMQDRVGKLYRESTPAEQTAILDLIAYRKNAAGNDKSLSPGIVFFDWIRRMVVDVYFTSPQGTKDIGYVGNKGMTVFVIPKEAIDYAMQRVPA